MSEEWDKENEHYSILQSLMRVYVRDRKTHQFVQGWNGRRERYAFKIGRSEATIVATVMQWIGTNVGFSFIRRCLERSGYRVIERTDKWNASEPPRVCTLQNNIWAGNCPHCGRMFHQRFPYGERRASELDKHRALFRSVPLPPPIPAVHECPVCGGRFTMAPHDKSQDINIRERNPLLANR